MKTAARHLRSALKSVLLFCIEVLEPAPPAQAAPPAPPTQEKRKRLLPLGFEGENLQPNETRALTTQVQVDYRPTRLIVPSELAGCFRLEDIRIGNKSCSPSAEPIPCDAFTERGNGTNLDLGVARVGQTIALVVTNNSKSAKSFSAAFIGEAIEN